MIELPTIELLDDLKGMHLDWVADENIVVNNMTDSQQKDTQHTIIQITETDDQGFTYGNNQIKGLTAEVEMQIFWQLSPTVNILLSEIELQKQLIALGWKIASSTGHVVDPVTQQLTKTIYLTKRIGDI